MEFPPKKQLDSSQSWSKITEQNSLAITLLNNYSRFSVFTDHQVAAKQNKCTRHCRYKGNDQNNKKHLEY